MCVELSEKVLSAYLGNRCKRQKDVSERYDIPIGLLSNIKLIEKFSTKDEFSTLVESIRDGNSVLMSNGIVSGNFSHIRNIIADGSTVALDQTRNTSQTPRKDSCLYLLKAGDYYKIGVTLDSSGKNRIKQLQTGNPQIIELMSVSSRRPDAYEVEQKLFSMFANCRMCGEWFDLSEHQVTQVLDLFEVRNGNEEHNY